jgi:hypothetical protein
VTEVLLEFAEPVSADDGTIYMARACGNEMADGKWQGWIEFIPAAPREPVRSGRETTQPNRQDTEYWATGLTPVFLEGSLKRALNPLTRTIAHEPMPPIFDGPAPAARGAMPANESVLPERRGSEAAAEPGGDRARRTDRRRGPRRGQSRQVARPSICAILRA